MLSAYFLTFIYQNSLRKLASRFFSYPKKSPRMDFKQTLSFFLFFIILFSFSCKRNIQGEPVDESGEFFTTAEQITIGNQIMTAVLNNSSAFPILDKFQYEQAYEYLQDSVLEVIVRAPAMTKWQDFNWNANIIDLPGERHAFFLPNGEFFIHVELLDSLRNDAELLGIIAHELAYIEGDLVMKSLKSRFGGTLLNRVAEEKATTDDLNDIASYFNKIEYNTKEVLYADSFAMASICPFSYNSKEFKKVLQRFEILSPTLNIDWYSRKDTEFQDRKNKINEFLIEHPDCGGNINRAEEYTRFKDRYLP